MGGQIIQKWYELTIDDWEHDRYGWDYRLMIENDDRYDWDLRLVIENDDRYSPKHDWWMRTLLWIENIDRYGREYGDREYRPMGLRISIGDWELKRTGNKREVAKDKTLELTWGSIRIL